MKNTTEGAPKTHHFYALLSPRGIDVAYSEHNVPQVHGFTSIAERDRWVEDEDDPFNPQREPCSAAEAKRHFGNPGQRDCRLEEFSDCNGVFWH